MNPRNEVRAAALQASGAEMFRIGEPVGEAEEGIERRHLSHIL